MPTARDDNLSGFILFAIMTLLGIVTTVVIAPVGSFALLVGLSTTLPCALLAWANRPRRSEG